MKSRLKNLQIPDLELSVGRSVLLPAGGELVRTGVDLGLAGGLVRTGSFLAAGRVEGLDVGGFSSAKG